MKGYSEVTGSNAPEKAFIAKQPRGGKGKIRKEVEWLD
jgi:hypothetical protein